MQVFWSGLDSMDGMIEALIPDEWLRKEFVKQFSDEDKATIAHFWRDEKEKQSRHAHPHGRHPER